MDALLRKKDYLEQKLEKLRYKEDERASHRSDLIARIRVQKEMLDVARKNLEAVKLVLFERRQKFIALRSEVRAYKKARINDVRVEFENMYKDMLAESSSAHFTNSLSTFSEFTKIKALISKNVFKNLGKRLNRFYVEQKEKLKSYILSQMGSRIQDKKKIHELIFYMKFLCKYEDYFEEKIMVDFLYERLLKGFEYHFMSGKESNRLDKPEWFLDFILLKLSEDRDFFEIYLGQCRKRDKKDVHGGEGPVEVDFKDLILRSCSLVETKIAELSESGSKQRRNLLLHLGSQVIKFQSEVFNSYGVVLDFSGLGFTLYKEQKEYVQERLSEIHEKKYISWFDGYKELSKECLFYIYRFRSLDSIFRMDDVVKTIISYNTVFLESLRYINREEIRVICFLYSEFEEYKVFLLNQENEIVFDSRLAMESEPAIRIRAGREGEKNTGQSLLCDAVLTSIERISGFDSENLKLIMSLAMNDTAIGLRSIRRFLYSPSEASRNFMVDVGKFLEDYKGCSSYKAIKNMVKEKIDTFLLEDVLLRYKLDTEQYFELVAFLKGLKELFGDNEWKSDVASKCIGALFEGKETNGSLFKIIKKLYEQ